LKQLGHDIELTFLSRRIVERNARQGSRAAT